MTMKIDLKRCICIVIVSFILLTLISIQWIPFNYPTASLWRVLYWQIRDQLFIRHKYFFVFLFISVMFGILFSIKFNGTYRRIQKIVFYLFLLIWIWLMYFDGAVA